MGVTATFDFSSAEHFRASREVARRVSTRWLARAFAVLAIVFVALNIRATWGQSPAYVVVNALPWLFLGIFWLTLVPLMHWWAAKRLPARDASVRGPQTRTIDAEGYHSRGNNVALDIPWHAMVRAVETRAFFLFFYNKQCAYYLPKRALAEEQIHAVRALARAGLGDSVDLQG
jgi:hypothetical protein